MSFAGEVKAELCRGKLGRKCCAQAEACGVLLYCNRFSLSEVKIVTESPAFAQRLPGLFRKAFGVEFDEKGDPDTPGKRIFTISAPEKLALLWELCAFDPSGPAHHINFGMLEETHCRLAFLRGAFLAGGSVTDPQKGYHLELATTHLRVLLYCNRFSLSEVKIVTESPAFAQRLPGLFRKAFGVEFDEKGDPDTPGKRIFTISAPEKLALLWELCAFDPSGPAHHINFGMLEETHCRLAFLRGAFLAGGSVTDPQKGYHLELATTHLRVSRELDTLLLELGYAPKETTRKANYITYFKQSEAIDDLLTAIGAPVSAMELMNAKAEKLLRNGVNRRVNCEAANVDKTVDAALEQRRAIQILRDRGALETLSPKLREAAQLREAHPELSLAQLAALCEPPVTKSSLSHRLRKLIQLSAQDTAP